MRHPLEGIAPGKGARAFLPLLAATVVVMVALNIMDAPTRTAAAPQGIVSFELARTVEKAGAIVDSWNKNQRIRTGWGLGFDYLFMPLYSTTIAFACVWAARVLSPRSALLISGRWLAWGQWLAAGFDAVENLALFVVLMGPVAAPWPQLAFWCASVKFGLLAAGLALSLIGALLWIGRPHPA